ncbi:hypothetical protein TNCV_3967411 [Trichonephila clavipes]|nr:hypothetical protein TNCV_3967411 [Trichonephila clavipes]
MSVVGGSPERGGFVLGAAAFVNGQVIAPIINSYLATLWLRIACRAMMVYSPPAVKDPATHLICYLATGEEGPGASLKMGPFPQDVGPHGSS